MMYVKELGLLFSKSLQKFVDAILIAQSAQLRHQIQTKLLCRG